MVGTFTVLPGKYKVSADELTLNCQDQLRRCNDGKRCQLIDIDCEGYGVGAFAIGESVIFRPYTYRRKSKCPIQ